MTELLTVIAIIAILAALILSSLGHVTKKGGSVRCLSNLRQWDVALSMYTAEHRFYPPGRIIEARPANVQKWFDFLETYIGQPWPQSKTQFKIWERGDPQNTVASCPDYARLGGFSGGPGGSFGSYGYNTAGASEWGIAGGGELGLGGDTTPGVRPSWASLRPIAENEISAPADMIALGDATLTTHDREHDHPNWPFSGAIRLSPQSSVILTALSPAPVGTEVQWVQDSLKFIGNRHDGRWNTSFADGHVENLSLRRLFDVRNNSILRRWNRDNLPHRERLLPPVD
jgi:prepilin-type processing-associated H-X9-DG protein